MTPLSRAALVLLMLAGLLPARARGQGWVAAYYPGWRQARLPADQIDYDAVTHVMHFSVIPRSDGTLNASVNKLTPSNVASAVAAAHAAGKKILISVGGRDSRLGFEGAMRPKNRDVFVAGLIRFMRENRYDGIDIDMEDVVPANSRDYAAFVRELRERLEMIAPRPLLTAAVRWEPGLFARLAGRFDQLNLMTYNLSGPYPGWVTWHSGPLYDGGGRFPDAPAALPSADGLARAFIAAGVPRAKLGIGLSFDGSVWIGAGLSGPGQRWESPPRVKSVPYYALADAYRIEEYDYTNRAYRWDERAEAAYLSVPDANGVHGQFVSYANEVTAAKVAAYVRERGLGGMFVWDLGAGYRADRPAGRRDVLLQAVKEASARQRLRFSTETTRPPAKTIRAFSPRGDSLPTETPPPNPP